MDEVSLWIIPIHVRPVVSYENMKRKNKLTSAKTGLDRLNLTDVGEKILGTWIQGGGSVDLLDADLPYPWKASLRRSSVEYARMSGMVVGGSTFRSIFHMRIFDNEDHLIKGIKLLKRGPLDSPYWKSETWRNFQTITGMSRDHVSKINGHTLKELGI